MAGTITLYADETDPDTYLAWRASSTTLRNLTGWTLAAQLVNSSTGTVTATKSTGITGGDGTGTSNVIIAWTAAELGPLSPGTYAMRLTAVNGPEKAVFTLDERGTLPVVVVKSVPT